MRDDAMAADDDATPKPPPRPIPFLHPVNPPMVPEGLLKDYLDQLYELPQKQQLGWKPGYLDTDATLVKGNTKFFQTCIPKHPVEEYPYRSVFTGTPAGWFEYENYVRYMDLPESIRKGPLKDRSFRIIHIFHQLPSPAEGGEHGTAAILDGQPNSTGDGDANGGTETPRDRWEVRGDRVHRIAQVPRTRTCTPDSEPEPCPVGSERLTDRRVTICRLVEGLRDEQVVIDTWRDAPPARQTRVMSQQLWQGEIIFEMTHEEKLRRGLHRSLTLDEEHVAGETAIVPAHDTDEEVRAIVPRKSRESRILRVDEAAQAEKRPEDWTGFDVGMPFPD